MGDSLTDPTTDMGSLNYPYTANFSESKFSFHFENCKDSEFTHLVVGHSQIRGKWDVDMSGDLDFPMNWASFSGGKARFLGEEIKSILRCNDGIQLRISAVIWQNSIESSSVEELMGIATGISYEADKHPQHKVAFPTLHFVPQQHQLWDKIGEFNNFLRDLNNKNGFNPYNLHKTTMRKASGKGMKVIQTAWKEFNNNQGKGYHIDKHVHERYVKFIKTYHLYGFKDGVASRQDKSAVQSISVKHSYPAQVMRHPSERDVRDVLNNIRSVKRSRYGTVVMDDELKLLRIKEESQIKRAKEVIEESNNMIEDTLKHGKILKKVQSDMAVLVELSKEREAELLQREEEMDALEKDLDCREAELNLRESTYQQQLMDLGNKVSNVDLEIAKLEIEIARLKEGKKKARREEERREEGEEKRKKERKMKHK